jgi:PDZ domain
MRFIPTDEVQSEGDEGSRSSSSTLTTEAASLDPNTSRGAEKDPLQGSDLVQLSIWPHAPLGCVVEECLAAYEDYSAAAVDDDHRPVYVFVSAVKSGGYADRAGLRVGDVLVECTDLFGQLTDATRLGVEKVYVFFVWLPSLGWTGTSCHREGTPTISHHYELQLTIVLFLV